MIDTLYQSYRCWSGRSGIASRCQWNSDQISVHKCIFFYLQQSTPYSFWYTLSVILLPSYLIRRIRNCEPWILKNRCPNLTGTNMHMLLKMADVICAISPFQAKEPNIVQVCLRLEFEVVLLTNWSSILRLWMKNRQKIWWIFIWLKQKTLKVNSIKFQRFCFKTNPSIFWLKHWII